MGFVSMLEDIRDAIDGRRYEITAGLSRPQGRLPQKDAETLLAKADDTLCKTQAVLRRVIELAYFLKRVGIDPDANRPLGEEATLRRQAALQLAPELANERRLLQRRVANLERGTDALKQQLTKYKGENQRLAIENRRLGKWLDKRLNRPALSMSEVSAQAGRSRHR